MASTVIASQLATTQKTFNPKTLFFASCMALITTAMTFAIRASLVDTLGHEFQLSGAEIGLVTGTAFWGFTLSQLVAGPIIGLVGMKRLIILAFMGHIAGLGLTIMANDFTTLFLSTLLIGIANGLVEAVCNPLVASLFPNDKTTMLNRFHVWFPGGIVIGGVLAYAFDMAGLPWQLKVAAMLVPAVVYIALFLGQTFPQTERTTNGVSNATMYKACLKPLFLLFVFCMLLTASSELGTTQWISALLQSSGVNGILVLVFISGIMATGRGFAGTIVHKLAPVGTLLVSAIFTMAGLLLLSYASGSAMIWGSATVFAIGVCYFWPTMLGYVAEKVPESGEMGLNIMGAAGMLSVAVVLPYLGAMLDAQTIAALPAGVAMAQAKTAVAGTDLANAFATAKNEGAQHTLRYVAIMPAILTIIFGALVLTRKGK